MDIQPLHLHLDFRLDKYFGNSDAAERVGQSCHLDTHSLQDVLAINIKYQPWIYNLRTAHRDCAFPSRMYGENVHWWPSVSTGPSQLAGKDCGMQSGVQTVSPSVGGMYVRRVIEPQLSMNWGKVTQRPFIPSGIVPELTARATEEVSAYESGELRTIS